MDNGELKEFASAAKYYVDLVDIEFSSTYLRECLIASGWNLVTYAVWIRELERVVDGRTISGIAKDIECQRGD